MPTSRNPLDSRPRIREVLYLIQWGVTGVQTVLSAFFGFMHGSPADWPVWFLASLAVLPVLWSYLGVTAQTNVAQGGGPVSRNRSATL